MPVTSGSVRKQWKLFPLAKNVATKGVSIHIKRLCHIPVNVAIRWALRTGATGRKQVKHTPFESRYHCFTVKYKVYIEQTVQHQLLVLTINLQNSHQVCLKVTANNREAGECHQHRLMR
jgi:hypothetical protein